MAHHSPQTGRHRRGDGTNESTIDDFSDFGQGVSEAELQSISNELGIPVQGSSLIADVAESVKAVSEAR